MNAETKLCCLIGNPVAHSLSPMIHNTLAQKMGIDLAYLAFRVETESVEAAVAGAKALGILGMNVTVPHKSTVMRSLVQTDPMAERIGAVNTLVSVPGGYKGYNTDIIGLRRQLKEEQIVIDGRDVIILGAGGASRAITWLCADLGARRIYLLNRSVENARKLSEAVNRFYGERVVPMALTDYRDIPKGTYPVIQTTSVGLYPHIEEAAILEEEFYGYVETGVDIIFNPAETKFMRLCREHGARAFNGLKMLLYQGIAAFELWNGVEVPKQYAQELLLRMEGELHTNG